MCIVKKFGIKIVVIYFEVDVRSMYVCLVDEVYCVGGNLLSELYL
jgi:acetyl/propionyl-CoA carboxylase alpha subunit